MTLIAKKYRFRRGDRYLTRTEIAQIQETFERFSSLSQSEITETICEHLDWLTPGGLPKRQACRNLLDEMEEQGLIQLPKKRQGGTKKHKPLPKTAKTDTPDELNVSLKDIAPVEVYPVTSSDERNLWNEYIERYHPLGYKKPFGYSIRYFVRTKEQYLGCILISGASLTIAHRDKWIGWTNEQRKANLNWVVNNARYLIFPWVNVPHLASHVLGTLARRVVDDWQEKWGFSPVLLETFVDPLYYSGVCYQAAGWELLGETSGRGLVREGKDYSTTPKLIYIKPLTKKCKSLLCSNTLQGRTEL